LSPEPRHSGARPWRVEPGERISCDSWTRRMDAVKSNDTFKSCRCCLFPPMHIHTTPILSPERERLRTAADSHRPAAAPKREPSPKISRPCRPCHKSAIYVYVTQASSLGVVVARIVLLDRAVFLNLAVVVGVHHPFTPSGGGLRLRKTRRTCSFG